MNERLDHHRTSWHAIGVVAILGLTLAWYLHLSLALPYYYNWDMDLLASLDTLVVNNGGIPVHIAHPGFGLDLVHALTQRVAHAAGYLSIVRLDDLQATLNPLAAMAEYTEFLRLHSPIVAWTTVLVLWVALRRLLRPRPLADLALLALLASQDGLLYQAGLVRSELYSVFFWSSALALIVRAVDERAQRGRAVLLVAAGILLGVCYLTKLQAMFLVASGPLLVVSASDRAGGIDAVLGARTEREARLASIVGCIALLLFVALLLAAGLTPDPPREAYLMFTNSWPLRFSATGFAALAVYLAVAGLLVALVRRGRWAGPLFAFLRASALLLLGFVLAFALHLLPFGWSSTGIRYLVFDAKMLFFRSSLTIMQVGAGGPLEQLWGQIGWDPALFTLIAFVIGAALVQVWRARHGGASIANALALVGLGVLALANAAIAVRYNLRDLLWTQVLGLVAILAAVPTLFARGVKRLVALALLAMVLAGQLAHDRDMVSRLETNFNLTGFRADRWFSGLTALVTAGDHLRYTAIMQQHYGAPGSPIQDVALRAAQRYAESRRISDYVLQQNGIDLRRIGVLSEGFPLWVGQVQQSRIEELPEALREAIVVDPTGVAGRGVRFVPQLVREQSGVREKLAGSGAPGSLALLPRPDLRVFLFYEDGPGAARLPPCAGRDAPPAPPGNLVAGGTTLLGREITTYCQIAAGDLPPRHVVVIQPSTSATRAPTTGSG